MKSVIFDLDGTLLDTLEDLADSVNFALNKYGYKERTLKEIRAFVGNGVVRLMELALPNGKNNPQFESVLSDFKAHYAKNCKNKTKPYNGINELLKALKEENIKMAVVSNKFDAAVKELCKEYFGEYIAVAMGETAKVKKKPAPDTVFKAMEALNDTDCVYVGDSEVDIETAKNAFIPCISVTWGFRDKDYLKEVGGVLFADTPMEILNLI